MVQVQSWVFSINFIIRLRLGYQQHAHRHQREESQAQSKPLPFNLNLQNRFETLADVNGEVFMSN